MANNEKRKGSSSKKPLGKEQGEGSKKKLAFDPKTGEAPVQAVESVDNLSSRTRTGEWAQKHTSFSRRSWESSDYIDFDDLLPMIGQFGRFQWQLFLFMIPFCYITAFVYLGQLFMTLSPIDYYCFEPELELIKEEEMRKQLSIPREKDGSYSQCRMYDTNYSRIRHAFNKTALVNSSLPTKPCQHGYVFDSTKMPFTTATMEFKWVCDDDKYATYAQMIFFLGSILGSLAYGYFADHTGRLAALVSSCALAVIGSLGTTLSKNFMAFATFRFIVGASSDTCFTMIYILVMEYVGPKYRTLVANLSLLLFYTPFTMLMPWIALASGTWRTFAIMASLPLWLALFSYCILPESARWLVSVGEIDKAMEILENVIRTNKRRVAPWIMDLFRRCCLQFYKEEMHGREFTVFSIFRYRHMASYMILMIVVWMAMSLVYDGYVRAASVLDAENVFVYFTIACATELPGYILVIFTLDRFGRRWCSFAFTLLSGIFSLVAAYIGNATHMRYLALGGRFFSSICYNIGLQWAAEILPTVVRAQGVSFIHTMGFVAMIMSPPVVYLSQLSLSLMLTVLGVLGIVGGVLALFLPETINHELPQTLSEGNVFGKNQRLWHMPCCGPGSKRSPRRNFLHQGSSLRTLSRDEFRSRRMLRRTSLPTQSDTSLTSMRSFEKEIRTYDYK